MCAASLNNEILASVDIMGSNIH